MQQVTVNNPTLEQIRADYRVLDGSGFAIPEGVRLISHEQYADNNEVPVEWVVPNGLVRLFRWLGPVSTLMYALQLFQAADRSTVILVNGGSGGLWLMLGYLNRLPFLRRRTLFLWDVFVEYLLGTEKRLKFFPLIKVKTHWKEAIARHALAGYDLIVKWSRKQAAAHARYYRLPEEKFIFLPYKSNHSNKARHSQDALCSVSLGRFVFAGGNGKRDYKCLVDAVRGTDIPVIISATDPAVRKSIEFLPNIILIGAPEPAFAQLQSICTLAVVPMIDSGLKGGGEANFCNAMWHGKPVIACCNMAAEDYIIDGTTGFVVPSGDSELLRQRILELWNDPEHAEQMGCNGHRHVMENFTHDLFIRRLLRLAMVLGRVEHKTSCAKCKK
ncbi:MAG: glycosyltransferase [Planctomycetaceae bacterium]|nr:glycosyltransferase [Planctomycetaceae bacterium]